MIPIVYFGTHDFAASVLEALFKSGQFDIKAVVTQPDRPAGRHQEVAKSAVKIVALKYGTPLLQPESLKNFHYPISNIQLSIVCEYGLIIPENIISFPEFGTINVHYSLLPKYRGASPIQSALINGETKTGVTIMQMDKGLDHGAVLAQAEVDILPDDTYLSLGTRIGPTAAELLISTAINFVNGIIKPVPQDDAQATICRTFSRDDGKIDWSKSAEEIYNLYRGLTPWPGIWTTWNGKRLKFQKIKKAKKQESNPGVISLVEGKLIIGCGSDAIEVFELQLEGGRAMPTTPFIAGHKDFIGSILS